MFVFDSVPWKFGIITCVAGLLGVTIGAETGRRLRRKYGNADPLVCAFGLVGSAPMFCLAIYLADKNTVATWVSALVLFCIMSHSKGNHTCMFLNSVPSPWDCSRRFTLHPLADLFIPAPTRLLLEAFSHAVYCAKTIHSYFHHCLSELEQRGENENDETSKR